MKWTKMSAAVATVAITIAGLTACSGAEGNEAAEIEVLTGSAVGSAQHSALESAADAFEKDNPGVKIRLVPGGGSFEGDLKVRLAANNAPDVFNTHGWSLDRYSPFLVPLSDESWASDFNPVLDAAMRDEAGKFYALPIDVAVSGIVYSVPALEKAGVDASTITTWDAFEQAADAVLAAGIVPIAVSGKDNWTAGNLSDWAAPGYYSEKDLTDLQDGKFDTGVYAGMLERQAGWSSAGYFNKDYSSATGDDVNRLIATGEAAFAFQGNGLAQNATVLNPDVQLGFFPVPSEVSDPYLVGGESMAYGVSKTGEHKEIALDFLAYLAQPSVLGPIAESIGNGPGLVNAESSLGIMQSSYNKYVTEAATTVVPFFDRVHLPNGMWNSMVIASDAIITGQSSSGDAATQMKTAFDSVYGQD
ncbi:ABC transporter substrate-binding protein [Cryobacterium sp. TMT2-15-1]|uniref:ABC transporter substrate-binding protein n=1 Tax=Cryobacterium sp. TMT2-15-1 TaxID=1259246 RepID=UPI00141BD67D|nr:ABC transporter substrate-binding protein [Cryobacterium sp. TMT2-15-1]